MLAWVRPYVRPGGTIGIGDIYAREQSIPDQSAEHFAGGPVRTLQDTVRKLNKDGLRLIGLIDSSLDDWDRYESKHWRAADSWVRDNPDDPDLREFLHQSDQFKLNHLISDRDALGWALFVCRVEEAFYESYHLHQVHPETRDMMADQNVQYDLYRNGASRMIVPIGQPTPRRRDQTSMNPALEGMLADAGIDPATFEGTARDVRPALQRAKRERAERLGLDYSQLTDNQLTDSWATGIFPNVQIGLHPEGAFLMRFLPHPTDPERFYYDTMTLYLPTGESKSMAPAWMGIPEGTDLSGQTRPETEYLGLQGGKSLGLVLEQDSELLPVVQDGMRSRAFRGQLWGEQELRLRHFHAELDRYLGANH